MNSPYADGWKKRWYETMRDKDLYEQRLKLFLGGGRSMMLVPWYARLPRKGGSRVVTKEGYFALPGGLTATKDMLVKQGHSVETILVLSHFYDQDRRAL